MDRSSRIGRVLLGAALIAGIACAERARADGDPEPGRGEEKPEAGRAVRAVNESFERELGPLFRRKCSQCHDATARLPFYVRMPLPMVENPGARDVRIGRRHLDLEGGALIDPDHPFLGPAARLYGLRDVVVADSMPPRLYIQLHPSGRMSDWDRKRTLEWIDGALEILAADEVAARRELSEAEKVERIFRDKCTRCHNERILDEDGEYFPMHDLEALRDDEFLVGEPADEGVIFEVVDDGKMPPPEGSGLLTEEERETVLAWLMRGP